MSSILKALKKLEEEKAAKQGHKVDITRDILGSAHQHSPRIQWPLVSLGTGGAVVIGILAYLFFARLVTQTLPPSAVTVSPRQPVAGTGPSNLPASEPSKPAPLSGEDPSLPRQAFPAPEHAKAAPQSAAPAITSAGLRRQKENGSAEGPVKAIPVQKAEAPISARPALKAHAPSRQSFPAQPPALQAEPALSTDRPVISSLPAAPSPAKPASPVAASASPGTAALPTITVSGIAYNKESADRLAVINGVPVGEGKSVAGVKVEEIMPDRVRFSFGQKSFEVPVGRSNQ